jgi:hypothetical protein
MSYSLKQAAEATGKTKTTILRAIQTSKISATKDTLGAWQIDPAELHRVYKPVGDADVPQTQRGAAELYERLLAEKDRQIASLSEQLEAANEERRTTLRQLTAILTDQRARAAPGVIVTPPPSSTAPASAATEQPIAPRRVSAVATSEKAPAAASGSWLRRMLGGR